MRQTTGNASSHRRWTSPSWVDECLDSELARAGVQVARAGVQVESKHPSWDVSTAGGRVRFAVIRLRSRSWALSAERTAAALLLFSGRSGLIFPDR